MGTESTNVTTFKEGDRVLVTEGDLKNLDGVVASVNDEGKLMVKASLAELADSEPLPIEPQHVIKFFQVQCWPRFPHQNKALSPIFQYDAIFLC